MNYKDPGDRLYNNFTVTALSEYIKLFSGAKNEKAVGEASPVYLYIKESAEKIKELMPDTKLIVCLRNPADRAFSNYIHKRRETFEPIDDFNTAFGEEKNALKKIFNCMILH